MTFQKTPTANWSVPAHQDRVVPIPAGFHHPDFGRPTQKQDGRQAEAPIALLRTMLNVRVLLDAASLDDGPLEIRPGTRELGRITQADIARLPEDVWRTITGAPGDMTLSSPLLVHRSRRATRPTGRRVVQIEVLPAAIADTYGLVGMPL